MIQQKTLDIDNQKNITFQRKHQQAYLNHGFIRTSDFHSPDSHCAISNGVMKPTKLLHYTETKHSTLKSST